MSKLRIVTLLGGLTYGEWEPGNGTRYTALAVPIKDLPGSVGVVGRIDEGWLVVCGLTGRAYLLQKRGYLDPLYIAEKFGLVGEDIEYFTELLRKMLGR